MTDLRKAAEMALEALEEFCELQTMLRPIERRNALRKALAQPEQEPLGSEWVPCVKLPVIVHVRNQRDGETHISTREGITPVLPDDLIMRGVAGEEYPIGRELFERTYTFDVDAVNMNQEHVDETAKREHEPVAWMGVDSWGVVTKFRTNPFGGAIPLYKTPPKREWVGLTDEEIGTLTVFDGLHHIETPLLADFIRATEAKLKEKNGG